MSLRVTRSQSRGNTLVVTNNGLNTEEAEKFHHDRTIKNTTPRLPGYEIPSESSGTTSQPVQSLKRDLKRKDTRLQSSDHELLLLKQQKLRSLNLLRTHDQQQRFVSRSKVPRSKSPKLARKPDDTAVSNAVAATLIFASASAGTAVCIDGSGLVLTCAHCVAETREELNVAVIRERKNFWLLTAAGEAVIARCVAWDEKRDLALLKICAAQFPASAMDGGEGCTFATIPISRTTTTAPSPVLCIGHPGSEDLESDILVSTDYPVLAISEGHFLGYASGQDIQDNSEIGALMHDAWTYWGHSGAPLVGIEGLVGLHSSWDDETGVRRGIGGEAIKGFLEDVTQRNEANVVLLP